MKRFIGWISLLMVVLLFYTNCAFAANFPCEGYATKNAVNVRKKASHWFKIEFGKGKKGYVRGDLIALQTVREEIPASAAAPTPASVPTSAANPPATATSSEASGNDPFYLLRGLGVSAENWYKVEDNC